LRLDKSNSVTFVLVHVTPYQGEKHPVFIVQGVHKLSQFVKRKPEVTIPFIKPIKYAASCSSVLAAVDWLTSIANKENRMLSTAIMIWYVRDKSLNLGR
jgi:hypothetical protein